jgi:hypothetical protein
VFNVLGIGSNKRWTRTMEAGNTPSPPPDVLKWQMMGRAEDIFTLIATRRRYGYTLELFYYRDRNGKAI